MLVAESTGAYDPSNYGFTDILRDLGNKSLGMSVKPRLEGSQATIDPAIVILLNDHAVKLPSKYLCLYPKTWTALNFGQRRFFLQWTAVNSTKRHITGQITENKRLSSQL